MIAWVSLPALKSLKPPRPGVIPYWKGQDHTQVRVIPLGAQGSALAHTADRREPRIAGVPGLL